MRVDCKTKILFLLLMFAQDSAFVEFLYHKSTLLCAHSVQFIYPLNYLPFHCLACGIASLLFGSIDVACSRPAVMLLTMRVMQLSMEKERPFTARPLEQRKEPRYVISCWCVLLRRIRSIS